MYLTQNGTDLKLVKKNVLSQEEADEGFLVSYFHIISNMQHFIHGCMGTRMYVFFISVVLETL